MKKLTVITTLALTACATLAWGYENPIENQSLEIIQYSDWDLRPDNLYVGSNTHQNAMFVMNGRRVQSARGFIGYQAGAYQNRAYVIGTGSVWSNSYFLTVGEHGGGNTLSITDGGRVYNTWGSIGYQGSALENTVTVSGAGSIWYNSAMLRVGAFGRGNDLFITDGGRVYNTWGSIGSTSGADQNKVNVNGSGAMWNNSGILYIGGDSGGAGGPDNSAIVTNGGTITAETLVVYADNYFHLDRDGTLIVRSDFDASQSGFNFNNGGHLSIGGDLSGMYLDGTDERLTINGGTWINSYVDVGVSGSGNQLSITNGGRVQDSSGRIGIQSGADSNMVVVCGTGSVWINSDVIFVGVTGSGNQLFITDGGCVQNDSFATIGINSGASNNSVTVTGTDSVWSNTSHYLIVGDEGSGNALSITHGGRVQNDCEGFIGATSNSANNTVTVSDKDSIWRTFRVFVGGTVQDARGTDNSMIITNGGKVEAFGCIVYPTNTIQLASGGTLELSSTFITEADATLMMGISSTAGSGHGRVTAEEYARLDGTLEIALLDGFEPDFGDAFDLFNWGSSGVYSGFATIDLPSLSFAFGLGWNTNDLYTTGELSVGYASADTDGDGMPDGWELEFCGGDVLPGGNLDSDPHDNRDEYIAGTLPNDAGSYFSITNAWQDSAGFVVVWDPCVSGRVYGINWTNDLTGGFTPIVENIDFPQNSYPDATYNAEDTGFYQIDVQLKP